MKRILIIIMSGFILLGCIKKSLLPSNDIFKIVIHNKIKKNKIELKNKQEINKIIILINTAEKDLMKFSSDYELNIYYKDSIVSIFVKDNNLKLKGVTYKIDENLEEYLSNFFINKHDK